MYERVRVPGQAGGTQAISIAEVVELELLDPMCGSTRFGSDFVYRSSDPFAVTVVFRSEYDEVRWTFARELLVTGVHEPTGVGDVQLWPCLDDAGNAIVMIELHAPAGSVLVQAKSRDVAAFVHRMLAAVPLGAEELHVDVDASLAALLA